MKVRNALRISSTVAIVGAALLASGCASIVNGTSQVISVETQTASGKVTGASCKLENSKGVYYVTSPGTVTVHRAFGDMSVQCEKAGLPTGIAKIQSSTKGMLAGNLLFGGPIGAGVDMASGAAYDYPKVFQINMMDTVEKSLQPQPAGASPVVTGAMK